MFDGFENKRLETSGPTINLRIGGSGPPVLLLHGYPQTHVMWHKVAPALAERFTVVAPDLRGYGDSDKPGTGKPGQDPTHATYSKRATAKDQVEVMKALGFEAFAVVGHDRGARVAHRMCLDHPDAVTRAAVLDIVPTRTMYLETDMDFATAYYHWFFLIQPYDLPERLIGNDPEYYLEKKIGAWSRIEGCFSPEALAEYKRCFRDPATIHATCEDYRAAATIDMDHDAADLDRKVACPLLALWGSRGVVARTYDVLAAWRERAEDVNGAAVDCGHFLPEEAPEATVAKLLDFL